MWQTQRQKGPIAPEGPMEDHREVTGASRAHTTSFPSHHSPPLTHTASSPALPSVSKLLLSTLGASQHGKGAAPQQEQQGLGRAQAVQALSRLAEDPCWHPCLRMELRNATAGFGEFGSSCRRILPGCAELLGARRAHPSRL